MIRQGHIEWNEGLTLLLLTLLARTFLATPTLVLPLGLTASWLLILSGTAVATLFLYLTFRGLARYPGQSLWVVNEKGLGYLGVLLNIGLLAYFLLNTALSLREYAETFKTALLPETPISLLSLGLSLLMVYGSYQGLETLARTALVWAVPVCLGIVAVIALLWHQTQLPWLTPLLGPGLPTLLRSLPAATGLQCDLLLLPTLFSSFRSTSDATRAGVGGLAISGLIMAAVTAQFVALFGFEGSRNIHFPLYQMARLIYRGRYLQRVEAFVVLLWIFGCIIALTALLYVTARGLAETLRLPYYKPLIFPLVILVFAGSLVPESFWSLLRLEGQLLQWPRFILLGVVLVAVWIAAWRRPRRARREG